MKAKLIASHELEKCYSIAPIDIKGEKKILVAAEKINKCMLFDTLGNYIETVWDEPGGTMSMVNLPSEDGMFLATHKFYSPNDSKEAKIVLAKKQGEKWNIKTIKDLPHVHRFDIVEKKGKKYLIACTIKSNHKHKDDWSSPGKIYVSELKGNIEKFGENNQLDMIVIKDSLTRNHGYLTATDKNGDNYCLIGADEGIYKVTLPDEKEDFKVEQIIKDATSDMTIVDFDGDGEEEIITISPFHGENIKIYKKINGRYEVIFEPDFKMPFAHSIWSGELFSKNRAIVGQREGERAIVEFYYEDGKYKSNTLVKDVGSANIYLYEEKGKKYMVSTNREINEIAFYELLEK